MEESFLKVGEETIALYECLEHIFVMATSCHFNQCLNSTSLLPVLILSFRLCLSLLDVTNFHVLRGIRTHTTGVVATSSLPR